MDVVPNRYEKRAKSLAACLNKCGTDRPSYLSRHLIPTDESLWLEENFATFVTVRAQMIVDKVREYIPVALVESNPPVPEPALSVNNTRVDLLALSILLPEQEHHPILEDKTSLFDLFRERVGAAWAGRYRSELAHFNIRTIADFARVVMGLKLEFWYDAGYAKVYYFHKPSDDGQKNHFNQKNFGGWAWFITLDELEKRSF